MGVGRKARCAVTTTFRDAATFRNAATLRNATTLRNAAFCDATLRDATTLRNAAFCDAATLRNATLRNATLRNATFCDAATLRDATFCDATFRDAATLRAAIFCDAIFCDQMSLVTASTHIDARPEEVWRLVMDAHRLGDWVTIHRGLGRVDAGPLRVGYRMDQHIHLRGVSLDVHWTLVECEPCARAVWEGRGPARSRAHTEYALRPENGGTRFDYRNEFRTPFGPIGAIVSRALVGGIPRREAERTLERLRALLE